MDNNEYLKKIYSEKWLEKELTKSVKELGVLSLKLLPFQFAGLPDRLLLVPGGYAVFAEIKTTGKKPRKLQTKVMELIKGKGFAVFIIDDLKTLQDATTYIKGLSGGSKGRNNR